ncbi:hypothetical protein [Candidatus Uabimicrobium amorphum]|uniref:Uncharacterized protein n=1 Tax=Uabimicrobium amorphum TaxID=2596890 RepID=A0A5S9F5V4_UABAM|nr:hypothetical protein [Candidatus Uabimicrobium amorphum]BBM87247.1 hypothetical protein UABAM_05650 [Candidatus Uabimicrobium amorphum]
MRKIIFTVIFSVISNISATTIFETATMGPTNATIGTGVSADQFLGAFNCKRKISNLKRKSLLLIYG